VNWPGPTRADQEKFCRVEGWTRVRDAQGKTGSHHITYELALPDGRILRTRISHPPSRVAYGPGIWAHVLRDQLDVDDATFWACVRDAKRPSRGARHAPAEALPAELVALLTRRVGLAEHEVAAMTKEEAVARLNQYWSTGR
jgi:hypothetical protein